MHLRIPHSLASEWLNQSVVSGIPAYDSASENATCDSTLHKCRENIVVRLLKQQIIGITNCTISLDTRTTEKTRKLRAVVKGEGVEMPP
jgi:hypothetical protein